MLRDRIIIIMDLSLFTLMATLSVLSVGVSGATQWASKQSDRRVGGYDLQRGPVLYEAYYPDDQGPSEDRQRVTTYQQAIEDSQLAGVGRAARNFRNSQQILFPSDYNAASVLPEGFRGSARESLRNPGIPPRATSDQAYEVARQLKRFVEGLEQDPNSRDHSDDLGSSSSSGSGRYGGATVAGSNYRANIRYPPTDYDAALPNDQVHVDTRRLDNYMNVVLSAVKKEALDITKERLRDLLPSMAADNTEENVRVSRQQRFVGSDDSFDSPHGNFGDSFPEMRSRDRLSDNSRYSNENEQFDRRVAFEGNDYQDIRGPISQDRFAHTENIFQPRPQVISYVFSPTKEPPATAAAAAAASSTGRQSIDRKSAYTNNQPFGDVGNNLIGNESKSKKKVEKSDGLAIASIEVSEVPRHKTRHHHGENPRRRNHQRRAAAAVKADQ